MKGADVRRDVFTDGSVAARRSRHEDAILIRQAHRRAVDLELAVVPGAAHFFSSKSHDALLPRRELVLVERVT